MPHESVTRLESFDFVEKMAKARPVYVRHDGRIFTLRTPVKVVRFKLDENGEPVWL